MSAFIYVNSSFKTLLVNYLLTRLNITI